MLGEEHHPMQLKIISSRLTFWFKLVFPLIWISGFGTGTICLWLGVLHGKDNAPPPIETKYIFLAVWVLGTTFILWACAGLKRVSLDAHQLYVSNYLKEIAVPFDEIKGIKQNLFLNIKPITIYFRDANVFGNEIKFMPPSHRAFWSLHPIVTELKQLAGIT